MPIIALATLKDVSLQLNGMLMLLKIQQAMQDDAIGAARIHPAFLPVTRLKCSYDKISSRLPRPRLEKPRSGEPSRPALSYEHIENFTKALEVRRDLGNRASPVNWAHVKGPLDCWQCPRMERRKQWRAKGKLGERREAKFPP